MESGLECTFLDPSGSTLCPALFLHRQHVRFRIVWTILTKSISFFLPVVFDLYLSVGVRAGILLSSDSPRGKSVSQNRLDTTAEDVDDVLIRRVRGNLYTRWKRTLKTHKCGFPWHLPSYCP